MPITPHMVDLANVQHEAYLTHKHQVEEALERLEEYYNETYGIPHHDYCNNPLTCHCDCLFCIIQHDEFLHEVPLGQPMEAV